MERYVSSYLRDKNRKKVYDLLAAKGQAGKVEIAQQLGVSLQTVMKVMDYFEEIGLAIHKGDGSSALGRKPQIYQFNPKAAYALSFVLQNGELQGAVVDLAGEVVQYSHRAMEGDIANVITRQLPVMAEELVLQSRLAKEIVLGAGLGLPGIVNEESQQMVFSQSLGLRASYNLGPLLETAQAELCLPIVVGNDLNAAAFGECFLRGNQCGNLIYTAFGTGIGAGIILEGKVRSGEHSFSGEIGYMLLTDPVTGQAGKLDDLLNLHQLKTRWGFDIRFGLAAMEPKAKEEMLEAVSTIVASCLSNLVICLAISTLVLGGDLPPALGEEFIEMVQNKVNAHLPFPVVVRGQSTQRTELAGMALKVINAKLDTLLCKQPKKEEQK